MAIVSNLPFKLQVIRKFPIETHQEGLLFLTMKKRFGRKK